MAIKRDPILTCFFLCDRVIRDDITKKWGAIGLFNALVADSFPVGYFEMWFFCRFADAPAEIDMRNSITDPDGKVIAECSRHFSIGSLPEAGSIGAGRGWWEIGGRFKDIVFQRPGQYRVHVNINQIELGDSALYLAQA